MNTNIMVEFLINGQDFDPNVVTNKLRIQPTKSFKKGDIIYIEPNENIIIKKQPKAKFSLWNIGREYTKVESLGFELNELLSILDDRREELKHIKNSLDAEYHIGIVLNIKENINPKIYITSKLIDFCNYIESGIDIDTYIYCLESDEDFIDMHEVPNCKVKAQFLVEIEEVDKNKDEFNNIRRTQIESEYINTWDIEETIRDVIKKVEDKKYLLKKFKEEHEVKYILRINILIKDNYKPGSYIDTNIIKFCNDMGAEIEIEYCIES